MRPTKWHGDGRQDFAQQIEQFLRIGTFCVRQRSGLIFSGETCIDAVKRLPIGEWLPPVGAGSLHRQDHAVHGATRSGNLVFDSSKKHGLGKIANSGDQHGAPCRLGESMVQKRVSDAYKAVHPLVSRKIPIKDEPIVTRLQVETALPFLRGRDGEPLFAPRDTSAHEHHGVAEERLERRKIDPGNAASDCAEVEPGDLT